MRKGETAEILKIRMNKVNDILLKKTNTADLETLFGFQLDEDSNYLAGFTSKNPSDKQTYFEKYTNLLSDHTVNMKTIFLNSEIVGNIAKFEMEGNTEITYWIDKASWGKGIATLALSQFLKIEKRRPIYGRVAFVNFGSIKVLERCGFTKIGTETNFANARESEIEEYIYLLQ